MHIVSPLNNDDFKRCCDIYLEYNDPTFVRADPDYCLKNMEDHFKAGRYIRVIYHDRKAVGFITANVIQSKHAPEKILCQEYYCTNLKGFAAAKAVKLAHRDLVAHAQKIRVGVVMSCGSHMDPDHTFTRILEREGWRREGHVAILRFAPVVAPGVQGGLLRPATRRLSDLAR